MARGRKRGVKCKPIVVGQVPAPPVSKKSLRLLFQACRKKKHTVKNYVYPRTVEAAQDPFADATGKNKMFFVIACNLFPDSKIIQPSDSESDDEESSENIPVIPDFLREDNDTPPRPLVPKQRRRRRNGVRRIAYGKASEVDLSWRTESQRKYQQRRVVGRPRSRIVIERNHVLAAINSVVENYSKLNFQSQQNTEILTETGNRNTG